MYFYLKTILGVVDKLLTGLENTVFESKDQGLTFMNDYLKEVNFILILIVVGNYIVLLCFSEFILFILQAGIVRKAYQGCHSLEVI